MRRGTSSFDFNDEESKISNLDNKNTEWINYPGTWTFYLIIVVATKLFLNVFMSSADTWTALNVVHCVISFFLLHWHKGSPDYHQAQGEYNAETFWEQLDGGVHWTYTKKLFTLVPSVLTLMASVKSDYRVSYIVVNAIAWGFCTIPKFPNMHKVRLFGVNRTPGVDDEKDD